MFTVNDVMELTDQKRGTVDNFRSELQKLNLMNNNERFDKGHSKLSGRPFNLKRKTIAPGFMQITGQFRWSMQKK